MHDREDEQSQSACRRDESLVLLLNYGRRKDWPVGFLSRCLPSFLPPSPELLFLSASLSVRSARVISIEPLVSRIALHRVLSAATCVSRE